MILIIDCSNENAFVCLADTGIVMSKKESHDQKNHAGFLHLAIENLMKESPIELDSLQAIAVISGPGSYTGVRIAMATAKGLCFALKKPLILLNGLELLARACYREVNNASALYIPLIDARRMEVFTAVFNANFQTICSASNLILDEKSFENFLKENVVYFIGSGAAKIRELIKVENAIYQDNHDIIATAADFAQCEFDKKIYADLFSAEPLYVKPFFEG